MHTSPVASSAALLAALGYPVRLGLVLMLADGEKTVGELVPVFRHDRSVVSRHLRLLEHVGLVNSRRSGRRIVYRLADRRILELVTLTADIRTQLRQRQ